VTQIVADPAAAAAGCQVVRVLEPPASFPADYLARDKDHLALLAWETVQVGHGVIRQQSTRHASTVARRASCSRLAAWQLQLRMLLSGAVATVSMRGSCV
jgi:hypothetical protein